MTDGYLLWFMRGLALMYTVSTWLRLVSFYTLP